MGTRCLKLARDAAKIQGIESEFIFPGAEQWGRDDLMATGHDLRRAYKPIAASIGLPEEISERLIGHKVGSKISKTYNDHVAVIRGPFFRDAQRKVSRKMIELFGCDPTLGKIEPPAPSPRDVAETAGLEKYQSDQRCPAGHVGLRYVATNRCVQCTLDRNFRQKANRVNWRKKKAAVH